MLIFMAMFLMTQEVKVIELGEFVCRDPKDLLVERITEAAALKTRWDPLHRRGDQKCPEIDFKESMLFYVPARHFNERVDVQSVKEEGGVLRVTLGSRWVGGGMAPLLSYSLVSMKRSKLPVEVVEQTMDRAGKVISEKVTRKLEGLP
jgi:hypothetical protein